MPNLGECASRPDFARELGITRARITPILGLLELPREVVKALPPSATHFRNRS